MTSAIVLADEQKQKIEAKLLATTRYETMEIEYKVDEIPADISVYKFTMTREGINGSMNTFVPSDDAVGAWQTGEVTISGLADNEALELVVTASYAGNIYFKNIKVEEIEQ